MTEFDVLVVGSGFGGSVAALRAAEKGYRVAVLEAGRRFGPSDFPRTNWHVRRYLWLPRLGCRGIQRLTLLRDVLVLSGAGVGGGSLVYANTLNEPLDEFYDDPQWAEIADWRAELAPYFELGRRMLGAVEVPFTTPADEVMRQVANRMGVGETFRRTEVAVHFGPAGPDPYFGGAGPSRGTCVRNGGCMVGCRHDAKNTLDRNYLYLAERAGAVVLPEREAVCVRAVARRFEVETQRPGAWTRRRREVFRAEQVVLAAGVLGTLRLLGRSRLGGPRVGHAVRTNSEAIVGASARRTGVDYSAGVAITSAFRPRPDTEIQPVRYPPGSNLLGLLGTILVDGGGRVPRQVRFAAQAARHPLRLARSLSVRRWSERTIVLLVMQSVDNALRVRWTGRRLVSRREDGAKAPPSYIPEANEAARLAAELIGGDPGSSLNEVLLDVPTTAHILGGACIGASPERGVVDAYHRVFAVPGLHVVDGSAVSANPGTNPALTIVAQAERALSFWPTRGDPDPRPPLGERYQPVGL
ncbi:MAG TPA: GMC family oxidoreductase [Gaiellaceae bacterium]